MLNKQNTTMIRIPKKIRNILKQVATKNNIYMYQLIAVMLLRLIDSTNNEE